MTFVEFVTGNPFVLAEGSVIERVRRSNAAKLDPHIDNTGLVFDDNGRGVLRSIYSGYLDVGRDFDAPMLILLPTWRANPERLALAGFDDTRGVHQGCYEFIAEIRAGYGGYAEKVKIGGLMGCRGDAYRPGEAMGIDEAEAFHEEQVGAIAAAGVDFIVASTLPARTEAVGMARAMARSGLFYVPSFIVRADGALLDGTRLDEVVGEIDDTVEPAPAFYMLNCVFPDVYMGAWSTLKDDGRRSRIVGIQANTSARPPEELDELEELDTADPDEFGARMAELHRTCGVKILGGCCGTDERHIRKTAERLV